jgi:DNA polymerase III subunit delta'
VAFKDFPDQRQGVELLQRSLERGRLGHAYLFTGSELGELEALAVSLARTLNCLEPICAPSGAAIDCCGACLNCRKIEHGNHADVHWIRPESKSRAIRIEQMRDLMHEINLKPTEARYKVAIVSGADRMNVHAANAFLKTLEEPPPNSVLVLLTTDPQRLLETILSRCLRLNFAGEHAGPLTAAQTAWLSAFGAMVQGQQKSLLARYLVLDVLLQKLAEIREKIDETLSARSPLEKYDEAEKDLRDKWEEELAAAIEAEYRRQRSEWLLLLQRWFRDVWVQTLAAGQAGGTELLSLPEMPSTRLVAARLSPAQATQNLNILEDLQRLLNTNVQEALALEVGLLKLHL